MTFLFHCFDFFVYHFCQCFFFFGDLTCKLPNNDYILAGGSTTRPDVKTNAFVYMPHPLQVWVVRVSRFIFNNNN
jgi:hypothetical protein